MVFGCPASKLLLHDASLVASRETGAGREEQSLVPESYPEALAKYPDSRPGLFNCTPGHRFAPGIVFVRTNSVNLSFRQCRPTTHSSVPHAAVLTCDGRIPPG